jgi:selenoprotein W-related protein
VTDELLTYYDQVITRLVLVPSHGGRFDVTVDGAKIFSKQELHRHAEPGEIVRLVGDYAKEVEKRQRKGL